MARFMSLKKSVLIIFQIVKYYTPTYLHPKHQLSQREDCSILFFSIRNIFGYHRSHDWNVPVNKKGAGFIQEPAYWLSKAEWILSLFDFSTLASPIKSINILSLHLGQATQNLSCHRSFFHSLQSLEMIMMLDLDTLKIVGIGGPVEVQDGRLKMRLSFPIQSSDGEQVDGYQPAGFWIEVPVRGGTLQSLLPGHRVGNACAWVRVSGVSCSCSHFEGACSFCYLSR